MSQVFFSHNLCIGTWFALAIVSFPGNHSKLPPPERCPKGLYLEKLITFNYSKIVLMLLKGKIKIPLSLRPHYIHTDLASV